MAYTIDAAALRTVCPWLSRSQAKSIAAGLGEGFKKYEITSPKRAAAAVAQFAHESAGFRASTEFASGAAYEGRKDLGNIHPGDGVKFKGRGRIMITGRTNYTAVSKAFGKDFVSNPTLLAQSPWADMASCWWWKNHGCNELADSGDFVALTRRINGGTNGLADRQQYHAKAKKVAAKLVPKLTEDFSKLTTSENLRARELEARRRIAKRNGGWEKVNPYHLKRARLLKALLTEQRKRVWRAAQQTGWNKANRRERYEILSRLTK